MTTEYFVEPYGIDKFVINKYITTTTNLLCIKEVYNLAIDNRVNVYGWVKEGKITPSFVTLAVFYSQDKAVDVAKQEKQRDSDKLLEYEEEKEKVFKHKINNPPIKI